MGHIAQSRGATVLAWGCAAVALAFTVLNLWLLALNAGTQSQAGLASTPLEVVTGVAYIVVAVIGLAVLGRRRDNRVGWVFLLAGTTLSFAAFASEYATYGVLTDPGSLVSVPLVAWAGSWSWWVAACFGLTFGLMLFPDGSLPSPRWRGAASVAAANLVVLGLLHALAPGPLDGEYSVVVNPVGVAAPFLRDLRDVAWVLVTTNAVIAAAALLTKARSASAARRRQLWWLVVPAVGAAVAAPVWALTSGTDDGRSPAVDALVLLVVFGTPLAVASSLARAATLRRSVDRLVLAREEERRRIRRDLHDGLGPTLAGVALQLDVVRGIVRTDPDAAEAILVGLLGRAKEAIRDVRWLVDDLRPPVLDQLGLVSAIREGTSYLARRGDAGGLAVVVETAGNLETVPPATEVIAFRIVMEAVTNASRHGQASRCVVHLALDKALEVRVEDDGRGLDPDHLPGVGLRSMQERAAELGGTCAVEPRPGGGTVVLATLPIGERS